MRELNLPEAFQKTLKEALPEEAENLIQSIQTEAPISIRLNPFKNNPEVKDLEKVAWTENAFYLPERPPFYADPYFHSGAYYVQEASSMIIEYILKNLNLPDKDLLALDLCAAPGGKSTILSSFLEDRGVLVSNEIVWKRNLVLQENIERWGQANTIITHNNSTDFRSLNQVFDLALVDAPCSGEGMFRKDPRVIQEWSPANVENCAVRQTQILEDIVSGIKIGGMLLYSTCTYNEDENENQIEEFLENHDFECLEISGLEDLGIKMRKKGKAVFYRLFPHRIKGEGLSISILRKRSASGQNQKRGTKKSNNNFSLLNANPGKDFIEENPNISFLNRETEIFALKSNQAEMLLSELKPLRIIRFGTHIGDMNRNKFIPSHGLALSVLLSKKVDHLELDESNALRVLQRDASHLEHKDGLGEWLALSFQGNTLALAKNLSNRINIHLPKTFRIRKNIDEFL